MDLKGKDLFIFDMDGVIYRHTEPIIDAIRFINLLKEKGKIVTYLTNNSTQTPELYVEKLKKMGIDETPDKIYTSATITADILQEQYRNKSVYVIGMTGLRQALINKGFSLLNKTYPDLEQFNILPDDVHADLVVMGMDTKLTYSKLRTGMMLIIKGAEFYATNNDFNFPVPGTLWPGTGAQIAFLSTALGRPPIKIFGKPEPEGIYQILKKFDVSPEKAVLIGDRLNTDINAGNNANISTILVETGINTSKDAQDLPDSEKPSLIIPNLKEFLNLL